MENLTYNWLRGFVELTFNWKRPLFTILLIIGLFLFLSNLLTKLLRQGSVLEPIETFVSQERSSPAQIHIVESGESLWKIAHEQFGDAYSWVEIYRLNRQLVGKNPNLIYPGQQFTLSAS